MSASPSVSEREARRPEEFERAANEHGIKRWDIHRCGRCQYPCAYLFCDGYLGYDAGCDCVSRNSFTIRSWDDVAAHYNLQSSPEVIAEYDAFWHFVPALSVQENGGRE